MNIFLKKILRILKLKNLEPYLESLYLWAEKVKLPFQMNFFH